MAGVTSGDLECPVCHEDFTVPKLLPCNHRVCRHCVIAWLQKEGGQGGCPLCRAPILPSTQQDQGQLSDSVDALPTDYVTAALVKSQQILTGPHVCAMCQNNATATSYCFECKIKLCVTCLNFHQRLPASTDHSVEQISKLTAKRLAANSQATCNSHSNRPAELYCSTHQELICMLCDSTNHRSCAEVKAIRDVAKEKRTELTQQSQRLKEKGAALEKQMEAAKAKFKDMRSNVKAVFDDLQQCLDKRRQQVNDIIQKEEDATMTSLAEMEKARAALTSHSGNIDHLVTSAPDDALLQMLKQLKSRLDDLESESGRTTKVKDVGDIILYSQLLTRLKSYLSQLGHIAKPRGAALARVLKVGDRVRPGPDWGTSTWGYILDKGGLGTVTAIPSRSIPKTGWVDVRWDSGHGDRYRMGSDGGYELDLAHTHRRGEPTWDDTLFCE